MNRKTTNNKADALNAAAGNARLERMSLAESRDKIFDKFYNNIRLLVATEKISMVDLSRKLSLKSGTRISDMCYGKAIPSTEELIILAKHYGCTIDHLLNARVIIAWEEF
jgi:hypothetical protein